MHEQFWQVIEGGVTASKGFLAAGVYCGLKKKKKDLSLVYSQKLANAAGLFTTNKVKAAPVIVSMEHLKQGKAQAFVANSGNANACTGLQGIEAAKAMAVTAAELLGIAPEHVVVASTGIIGVPLCVQKVVDGINTAVAQLSGAGHREAAEAIMTTDTFTKEVAVEFTLGGKTVRIGAMAKGSGMIHPNMATTLSLVTTDVAIATPLLHQALKSAIDKSINMISVDGDTSTNDMVAIMANGLAGNAEITAVDENFRIFQAALDHVCIHLAKQIARDGEGATKLLEIRVNGAVSQAEAKAAAMAVARSNLVKTAFFGEDPNWGRIMAALGYAGAEIVEDKINIFFGDAMIVEGGKACHFDVTRVKNILAKQEITVTIDLGLGQGAATVWSCDLSYDYVKINGAYST